MAGGRIRIKSATPCGAPPDSSPRGERRARRHAISENTLSSAANRNDQAIAVGGLQAQAVERLAAMPTEVERLDVMPVEEASEPQYQLPAAWTAL